MSVIREALSLARERSFSHVEVEYEGLSFSAVLECAPPKPNVTATSDSPGDEGLTPVTAPVVGYYKAAEPPLEVGKRVERGDIVGIVAALGLANEVESPVSGEVVQVLVEPDQPVEFGQSLALVRPGR